MTQIVVLPKESVILSPGTGGIRAVDISAYSGSDYISVSMPAYPATKIDPTQSFLDLTSNPDGDFSGGLTDSVAFSNSSPALSGSDGDAELRLPISLFATIDKSHVAGVRFRIHATANCSFRALRVRACSANWKYAPTDIDTLYERVERPPSPNGAVTPTIDFPSTSMSGQPGAFPILWRSDDPTSAADPQPIDVKIGAGFLSGSLDTSNAISLYFREIEVLDTTMSDLEGLTFADLEAEDGMPDFATTGTGIPAWIRATVSWDNTGGSITFDSTNGSSYVFPGLSLTANTNYLFIAELVGTTLRAAVYPMTQIGEVTTDPELRTNRVNDPTSFPRRRGRFGWHVDLGDGDAYLTSIRPRALSYGEFVASKAQTSTPVVGGRLLPGNTTEKELIEFVDSSPWGGDVSIDTPADAVHVATTLPDQSGISYKVVAQGGQPLQGIGTNAFWLDDLENTRIEFDIKFPLAALNTPGAGLTAFLYGELGRIFELPLFGIDGDSWSHVRIDFADQLIQTGTYAFVVLQTLPAELTTWYLDNLSVKTKVVDWFGRSYSSPWHHTNWVGFDDLVNKSSGGILFAKPGKQLQVRGKAVRHNAEIHGYQAVPKYAELGRLTFQRAHPGVNAISHTISSSTSGKTVSLSANPSPYYGSNIVAYTWNFGDGGFEFGPKVTHTYAKSGTYHVTLNAITGNRGHWTVGATVTV